MAPRADQVWAFRMRIRSGLRPCRAASSRYMRPASACARSCSRGMDSVLAELSARGLRLGIVTNKPAWLTDPLLAQLDLRDRFACVVSGDTVSERKPHPLPMLHAAKLAGVGAEACIYVGDAERDVQAAHAAGMPALVATYGYLGDDEDWRAWGGDGSVAQPLDLLGWLDRSGRA